jgi:hypothetical protein
MVFQEIIDYDLAGSIIAFRPSEIMSKEHVAVDVASFAEGAVLCINAKCVQ